ncbi:putative glutathione peroxidase 8-B [Chionoecetes opilio]|uniref:Glutathione peroxidase n=1 Tax=Chionoecetes opilio TaxID=41210 RepID=A0A8J4XN29_CHIOP|nr:putative glutathione peroxidase 8-B [Chionoecetes opilio]
MMGGRCVSRLACLALLAALCFTSCLGDDFYSYTVKDHQGQDVALEAYRGKVTLVVNVASQCGYTDITYQALKKLHDILSYGDHFSVLAFPCNQFGEQEPLEIAEIVEHVTSEYEVEFPIFNKIDIVGEHADPAFLSLSESSSVVPDWNFYKYLVDGSGQVVSAWGTRTTIEEIFDEIHAEVKKAKAAAAAGKPGSEKAEAAPSPSVDGGKDEL